MDHLVGAFACTADATPKNVDPVRTGAWRRVIFAIRKLSPAQAVQRASLVESPAIPAPFGWSARLRLGVWHRDSRPRSSQAQWLGRRACAATHCRHRWLSVLGFPT
jgi:hypothetical protein